MKAPTRKFVSITAALLFAATLLPTPSAKAAEDDPFQGALFDAELVLTRQQAIGLSREQRDAIVVALQRTQAAVVPFQLEMSAAAERLLGVLGERRVDVDAALAEAEEVMRLETAVKLEHIALLVEIKNLLTAEQQRKLDAIRRDGGR